MKLKMAPNSVFAILLRSAWWISAAVTMLIFLLSLALLPRAYAGFGVFAASPFFLIAVVRGWRQWRAPSQAQQEQTGQALRAMNWNDFAQALETGFAQDGSQVKRLRSDSADFVLQRAGKTALVSARRWKAARTGVVPLRALQAARQAQQADEAIYIAIEEISATARQFASEHDISLITEPELTRLLPALKAPSTR